MDKVQFRGSSQWKKKRLEILKRDHKQCCICGSKIGLQVHHIISLDINDKLKLENNNLITLCKLHHNQVHNGAYSTIYLANLINEHA
nr:MAG TPA: NinG recombination protein [Caudoviricetes sp.]